ncbi:MAG: proton-conducting transporter membrane subunit [Wenzhouxiangella sp.]|jgi:formate hydrogenlyase subunit 3/multisubunit Na+/H+ antiporter MnhD subunit|nr:proton-conducting transporter membrane subunit [Wenzhouxiangella sp.]
MTTEALALIVFLPLLAAAGAVVLPKAWLALMIRIGLLPLPVLLLIPTLEVAHNGAYRVALAGHDSPLGIAWQLDPLSLLMLWLNVGMTLLVSLHAGFSFRPGSDRAQRFWPLWLLLFAGMNALVLSADLFNIYVTLELVTLTAIGLIAVEGKPAALRAAMRYLLLALMASLLYLLGVGLIYGETGVLDLYMMTDRLEPGWLAITAMALMIVGLLIKAAIFPLHAWLPAAHGNAPGPVSAILSAMVVKVSIYLIWRLWFWSASEWNLDTAAQLMGVLGGLAIIYGSLAALVQPRLKMIIAYSTVAQLGYLLLLFPLASALAFQAASYHLISHGMAKAAMFLAAANILKSVGTDRLSRLAGIDQRLPLDVFALALGGVSIMGLPPSGGFLAKWLFLEAAWQAKAWGWLILVVLGGLLAAAYLFRVLAVICLHPRRHGGQASVRRAPNLASVAALLLALGAIVAGFTSAPILDLVEAGLPPGLQP